MAKAAPTFDVWFLSADQIYRGVPYQVLAGWVEQGRVAGQDRVRTSGSNDWVDVSAHDLLADYLLPVEVRASAQPNTGSPETTAMVGELDVPEPSILRQEAEDDDVDMIPLIDVSLVLLIFFILTSAVSTLSPIDVPGVKSGMDFSDDKDAITIQIDLRDNGEAFFAIQVGEAAVERDNNNLDTANELRARLNAILGSLNKVPEARIAANEKVKHGRVQDVMTVLDEFRRRNLISVYRAEVSELPK